MDLAELARLVPSQLAGVTQAHILTVEADGTMLGLVDGARISQLLLNLVENAVKYSPRGGDVRISLERQHSELHITVSDDGIGIPADDQLHIFERFWRGSGTDDCGFAGMGLGLLICRRITEEHGGRIWVESVEGQGSKFHVALPAATEGEMR